MPGIAIFLHQLAATGVTRNALAIGRHMQAAGWRVVLITVRPGGELAPLASGLDHVVLGAWGLPRKLELLCAVPSLRREIAARAPDVLLSAGNHAHLAVVEATRRNKRSKAPWPPTVYRISNDLTHGIKATHALAALSFRRFVARRVVREATRLVLVSPHLGTDPILAPALRSGKARVIANGVDLAVAQGRAEEGCSHPWAADSVPIVLAVGRLARQKNFATLVAAFAAVRSQQELRLMIVGGGGRRPRRRLERQARELGVGQDITFIDRVSNPFPFYRAAKVFALPSVWEGSPNVLLEALACGLPVVASRLAGNAAQILDDGRYGLLVDPCDVQQMASAILTQLDPARQVPPGDRAAAYDRPRAMAQYCKLFEELVALKPA